MSKQTKPTWNSVTWRSANDVIEEQNKALIKRFADANYYPRSGGSRFAVAKVKYGID